MKIKQHPGTGLWIREDGAVCIPPCCKYPKFRWTYGCKDKRSGYMRVHYRGKHYQVHRLVAETFLDNPLNLPTVDHFPNRDRTANFVGNLRWADYKMQADNTRSVDEALAKYGVRKCENETLYHRARYAADPEHERTIVRKYQAKNAEQVRNKRREWRDKQRALGRRYRVLPNGKRKYLTDEEFNKRYGKS